MFDIHMVVLLTPIKRKKSTLLHENILADLELVARQNGRKLKKNSCQFMITDPFLWN